MNSYHIFYFPFKWENPAMEGRLFSEQTDLSAIPINPYTNWLRNPGALNDKEKEQLYNEENFYYQFLHPVLYDNNREDTIIHHYERKEPQQQEVTYHIAVKGKIYRLKVDAINLNLYATGVGMLTFFLANMLDNQQESNDILTINQYGRRTFPPFFDDIERKSETAQYIQITGLNGDSSCFRENYSSYALHHQSWKPACFILNLIKDLSDDIRVVPVIDDRMFVNCWYANNRLTEYYQKDGESLDRFLLDDEVTSSFWYKYIYVDVNRPSCLNLEMRKKLMDSQTYKRWQKDGMLYGISRYSFVFLLKDNWFQKEILAVYMQTVYSRMIELILVQRASRLRFSDEVSRLSALSKKNEVNRRLIDQISSLYKEYIRFINQIHFQEVSAQDQGIELYQLLYETLSLEKSVRDLDKEIAELNQYVNILDDKIRNRNAEMLNYIAAGFLPASTFFCFLSATCGKWSFGSWGNLLIGLSLSGIMILILRIIKNK